MAAIILPMPETEAFIPDEEFYPGDESCKSLFFGDDGMG